jgi:hypothetical protein
MAQAMSARIWIASARTGRRHTSSQSTALVTRYTGSTGRPTNTRAPVQVTAKEVNSKTLARLMEIKSGAEP